ncbi:FAD-dependent oxidoreductase [Rhizobium halophilum]|uniref:FAD-dependent oxidoreductase n=1 Tax=Rhizobium halophilum TaxID=2846852 RepID=UPI001EFDC4B2|nr:FAD-dependent oxidoreductase [Rhizobium halophilum]MCF6370845.1 FAD-dependent oxidoreductase [Rhizobium halophilum]
MLKSRQEQADIVVVGGGAGGVSAAVAASRLGARVTLVERYGFLGGAAANSLVLAYCGFFQKSPEPIAAVRGVGADLLSELAAVGQPVSPVVSRSGNWIVMLDPEAVKFAFDRLCEKAGVRVLLHSRLTAVGRNHDRLAAVTVCDHAGTVDLDAKAFIDASGEAGLSSMSGTRLTVDSLRGDYVQPASMPVRIGGVAKGAEFDRARMAEIVNRYNVTADTPIPRADGGVLSRLPISEDVWWMTIDLETDGLSGESLTSVEREARRQAWRNLAMLKQMPGFEHAYLAQTGPQIGIRESRRPLSRQDITGSMLEKGLRRPDGVGRAAWPMEVHEAPGRARFVDIGGEGFADIPLGAVQSADIYNLYLAGRVTGADSAAYGSVRVMGTAFATGHAAGVAAATRAQGTEPVAEDVRRHLLVQGAIV